jgi:hypothetical protein
MNYEGPGDSLIGESTNALTDFDSVNVSVTATTAAVTTPGASTALDPRTPASPDVVGRSHRSLGVGRECLAEDRTSFPGLRPAFQDGGFERSRDDATDRQGTPYV